METGRALRESSRPVTGWRAWTVVETRGGLRLGSVLHDLVWSAGAPVVAECRLHEDPFAASVGAHPVPGAACNCGFHRSLTQVSGSTAPRNCSGPKTFDARDPDETPPAAWQVEICQAAGGVSSGP